MLSTDAIKSLPDLPTPVLSVYLNTSVPQPAMAASAPPKAPYRLRLASYVEAIAGTVPSEEQKVFREQARRVEAFLAGNSLPYRGIIVFAGPDTWEVLPVQAEIQDEVVWGAPALAQLFWLSDEHRPYGVVLAGRKGAQFFRSRLGEITELDAIEFRLEESRRKEMGPTSRQGVRVSRGTDRDTFESHLDAQYARYYRQIAERIERWQRTERLDPIFLAGLTDVVRGVRQNLAQDAQQAVVLVEEGLGWMSPAQVRERMAPLALSYEREREARLVEALLASERGVTIGVDHTLAELQQGRIRKIVLDKEFGGDAYQCAGCGLVDRTAGAACPVCNRERNSVSLRTILPGLIRRFGVPAEIVAGEAAQKLRGAGGMAGWLCEMERKEYSSTASSRA